MNTILGEATTIEGHSVQVGYGIEEVEGKALRATLYVDGKAWDKCAIVIGEGDSVPIDYVQVEINGKPEWQPTGQSSEPKDIAERIKAVLLWRLNLHVKASGWPVEAKSKLESAMDLLKGVKVEQATDGTFSIK